VLNDEELSRFFFLFNTIFFLDNYLV